MLGELVLVLTIGLLLFVWLLVNNNKINRTITTSKSRVTDSDSDDEGGLFGKPPPPPQQQQQQQQQPSLFGGPQLLPKSRGSSNSNLFGSSDVHSISGGKDAAGVENIRAMPDPSHSLPAPSTRNQKPGINLFASDSDDEGDLFSSRTPVSGKARHQSGRVQVESQQNTRTSGLFSSDDDAPLFSSALPHSTDNDQKNESEAREEPQLLSKSSGKKFQVPVGGVNIFGSAITSAIRRKQSSDSELSDDEGSNRGSIETSSTSAHKLEPPPAAHIPSFKESESIKKSGNIKGNSHSLGLFDDDDEEDLFSSAIKIPASTTTNKINEPKSTPALVEIPEETKSLIKSKIAGDSAIAKSETTTGKLFSDDDDDIFGISKEPDLAEVLPIPNSVIKEKENDVLITPRPADLPLPSEIVKKPSHPVKIPDPPKAKNSSLFSSPSDDDDLFSTPKITMGSTKPSSAFFTEPPPFEHESGINKTNKSQQDDLFSPATSKSQTGNIQEPSSIVKMKTGKVDDKLQPPPNGRLFSSPSDDDLFSAVPKTNKAQQSQEKLPSVKSVATSLNNSDTAVDPSASTHLEKDESQSSIFDSPEDDIFKSKSLKSGAKSSLFASNLDDENDIFSDTVSKSLSDSKSHMNTKKTISNIFETVNDDDDIFAVTQKDTKPRESLTQKEVTTETNSKLSSQVKTELTKPIDERTNFSTVAEGKNYPPTSVDITKEVTSVIQPKQSAGKLKKPAGGVALFRGSELAKHINKRKTLINSGGISDEESQKERNQPLQGEKLFKSEEKKDSSMSDIFDGKSGDDNLFGSSSLKAEKSPSLFHPKIPPNVPITTDTLSSSRPSKPETLSQKEPKTEEIKKEGEVKSHTRELQNEPAVINKNVSLETKVKTIDVEEKERENREISEERKKFKPTKKPPIGGVSMFGGGGIGGKELLARVQQRKSMMASESESEEEPTTTPAAPHPPSSLPPEETSTLPSPVSPTSFSSSSPVSPIPVFPSSPSNKTVFKSGGEESCISFDDPVSTSATLESLNKRRARGSQKRRPPSRAHRKSGINDQDPSDTPTTIMNIDSDTASKRTPTNLMPENVSHSVPAAASEPQLSSTPAEREKLAAMRDKGALSELSTDEQKVDSIRINDSGYKVGAVIVNKDSNPDKSNLKPVMAGENKKDAIKDDVSVLITKSSSALQTSKQDTVIKKASASLFDGSDSDEDLFGKEKQKSAPVKVSGLSAPNTTTKLPGKSAKIQSLFGDEDDDDDIFSSGARVGNTPVVPPQKSSATMPKTNLVTSSQSFEDPLLGSRK